MHQYSKQIYFTRNLKFITKTYGPVVSTFLAHLIDTHELRSSTRKVKSFYTSRNQIAEETQIKRTAQMTCESILGAAGILSIKTREYNANEYTIHYEVIDSLAPTATADQENSGQPHEEQGRGYPIEQGGAPSAVGVGLPNRLGANYINTKSIPRSVSKTRLTETNDRSDSVGLNSTCISALEDSPAFDCKDVTHLVEKYNRALGLKTDNRDFVTAPQYVDDLEAVSHFFTTDALEFIWREYADEGTCIQVDEPGKRRISAFIKFHLLEKVQKNRKLIASHCREKVNTKLDQVIRTFATKVDKLVEPDGFRCDMMGGIAPLSGDQLFTRRDETKMKQRILRDHLLGLLPQEDQLDMMALLEEY